MRPAKSSNSLFNQQQQQHQQQQQQQLQVNRSLAQATNGRSSIPASTGGPTSPICRCRVMYLGSSVPHITKDGLQGIQEPLRELYPDDSSLDSGTAGIDSRLSVWSNGILIENIDETGRENKRFFKIDALHYCAAVKYVGTKPINQQPNNPYTTLPNGNLATLPRFLPLDSPDASRANSNPPVFACILRRTTGIKVLECHAFICRQEAAANALVRCCFHAYADTMYAKQIGADLSNVTSSSTQGIDVNNNSYRTLSSHSKHDTMASNKTNFMNKSRSKSVAALNESEENMRQNPVLYHDLTNQLHPDFNHNSMIGRKSVNEQYMSGGCDRLDSAQQIMNNDLKRQQKFSKSLHHLNQNGQSNGISLSQLMHAKGQEHHVYSSSQSASISCANLPNGRQQHPLVPLQQQPFYNPIAARVPSYPPQNLIDVANGGGTLRSVRSTAANSIASTLLRSKKHAKAMSMAQLNNGKVASFHQPHSSTSTTMGRPLMMPPVPPMFLSNLQARTILNGSQTMQPQSRSIIPMMNPNINFESMTPKEMKRLLKKSAKYGLDPSKVGENGLPILPFKSQQLPHLPCHIPPLSKSGTMVSQPAYSDIYGHDLPDMASVHGMMPLPAREPILDSMEQPQMKPILVRPNPDFLKSKAGKKWLKQQKEFKKLLPPHLDGLPIIFGPPPINALEPAGPPSTDGVPAPVFIPPHPGLPMMDSTGYYNPHPFYGQNGRASAASTLLRYSPHSQIMHESTLGMNGAMHETDYMQRNQMNAFNNSMLAASTLNSVQKDYSCDNSSLIYGNNGCGIDMQTRHLQDNRQQQRNHMVEQSVISLGDENDYDEENDEQLNDYYSASNHDQEAATHSRRSSKTTQSGSKLTASTRNYQQAYETAASANDDQGSYSSGIYKRGHINERAFSYSIIQEHKSGSVANSDVDYTTRAETISNEDQVDQECLMNHDRRPSNMFQSKHECDDGYYQDNTDSRAIPVNELTNRLENQLSMKSFANSRIKSHM